MRHLQRVVFFLLVASASRIVNGAEKDSDNAFPKMKDIFTEFYQTEIEMTEKNQQESIIVYEFYDDSQSRGRMDVTILGERKSIYYNDIKKEILEVNATSCLASPEDQSIFYNLEIFYGWLHKDPLIVGPSAMLWFANDKEPTYNGTKDVRGIKCDWFQLKVDDNRNHIVFDYYFTVKDWDTPYNNKQRVPVRIEVSGESSRDSRKISEFSPVSQTVDFLIFRPPKWNWLKLQPPVGLGCYGRTTDFELPNVAKEFKFSAERYDVLASEKHENVDIDSYRIWFDNDTQLSRMDTYTRDTHKSELFDFNTGVIYSISDDKKCQIKPLRNDFFETTEGTVGYIKTPKQVLMLDGDFYYMGERNMRGIKCRTFEAVYRNPKFMNMDLYQLVVTVYFTNEYLELVVEGEDLKNAPVYYLLTGYSERNTVSFQAQYNIFGFTDIVGRSIYEDFHIEECFPLSQQKSYFVLLFPVQSKVAAKVEELDASFQVLLKSEISHTAGVSNMRIPFLKADYKTDGIYVTGLILDRPPALKQFWLENVGNSKSSDLLRIIPDATTKEECAYVCVNQTAFTCKGFHFCNKVCFLNEEDIAEEILQPANLGVCEIYVRSESNSNNREQYLKNALDKLDAAVQQRKFKIDLYASERETIELLPTEVIFGEGPFDSRDGQDKPYNLIFNGFQLPSEADSETTVEKTYVTTENDCYRSCKKDTSIACSSFSYCPDADNKQCRISSVLMVGGKANYDDVIVNKLCNVYSMMYMDFYEPYPGTVLMIPGEKSIKQLKSVEECAQKCRTEADFQCRGFEYCKGKKSCVLHSKHVLDLNPSETASTSDTSCTHYAAKYSADYLDMGYTLIDDDSNVRNEVTLEECARACSEELPRCKSFNYCPASNQYATDSTCSLTEKTLVSKGVKTTTKERCHLYTKRRAVEDWAVSSPKVSTSGYTQKGFVGLVIGMLFFGMIIGVIAFVGYSCYRSRNIGDGMSMRFTKQNDSLN